MQNTSLIVDDLTKGVEKIKIRAFNEYYADGQQERAESKWSKSEVCYVTK